MSIFDLVSQTFLLVEKEEWYEHNHHQCRSFMFYLTPEANTLSSSYFERRCVFKVFRTIKSIHSKRARSDFTNVSALEFEWDILVLILEAKNSEQSARQRKGLGALRHHPLPYRINDTGLLALLSSSLDYGHLLNYFLETNLFFNLGQMAIWPTVIAPLPLSPWDDLL